MEITRVDSKTYRSFFPNPYHRFNTVEFTELNKDKCLDIHYLIFKDSKLRFGIILGEKEDTLKSPFSAPFGGFSSLKNEKIENYESAALALKSYAGQIGKPVIISTPPTIYNYSDVIKTYSSLTRNNASVLYCDLNFQFELYRFEQYEKWIDYAAKKNLHNALKKEFQFIKLDSGNESDVERAYDVIRRNRYQRGFPLHMSLEAVLNTIKIIPADFFICSLNGIDMAAAQVFHVAESIAQVIYWGDIPEYSHLRVMNFLSYKVFEYYYNSGLRILDIGPSTEKGNPNYGLCSFKENIGCTISAKYTFNL